MLLFHQLAQAALTETIDIFRTDALDSAKAYAEAGDYIAAKTVLNEALQVLTNDSSLLSELNVVEAYIQDESITTYLDSINSAIAEGRYADAFDNMETALDDFPDNADLLTLKVTLESSYKEAQMAALNELYIAGDIDAALLLLADMQTYLPDDSEIPSLITQYESYKPTALSALTIYEENCHYAEYTMGVTLTDTYENIHTDAISLTLSHSGNGELVFLNNDKFNRFSGVLAYEYCSNTRGSGHIEVYADDELIYTSPTIDDSTKAFGFEAILPTSCHKLKLRWVADNDEYTNLVLANAQVYNR